ncbi:MAG TPA: prolyl oligopeptidase family serine peptidase, partial [Acidimicrobiales bacterium]|nr:prolyl oligopeptidase family serine peptidase [Acidimicrobiales bacterium]
MKGRTEQSVTAALCARGRTVAEPRLAPDGDRVAFVATSAGRSQLVVVELTTTSSGGLAGGPELVVTSEPAPRAARAYGGGTFDWLPDGSGFVYAAVDGGLWVQPLGGAPPRRVVEHGPAAAPSVAPDGARVAYVVDDHHVAVAFLDADADGPWPLRLSGTADFCLDPVWSPDGRQVAWHEWDVPAMPWDTSRIVVRAGDGSGEIGTVGGGEGIAVQQPRYSSTGRLAHLSDESGWLNLRLGTDADRGLIEETSEHGGPSWGHGQRSFAWSPDGTALAVCRNLGGFGSLGVVDVAGGEVRDLALGVHGGLSWVAGRLAAVRSGARTPTQIVVHSGDALDRRLVVARAPLAGFDDAGLVEPEVVGWPGDDGAEIPGRLYRPATTPHGEPPPLICWVHGGPTGQMEAVFNARVAFWVDRGWAVLVPDHRGSTGHGRAFTQALAGRWGELDVSDVAAGLRAAADEGWGHRRRLVAMGGSAGGFTVLNLLASSPECCAAGVDLYGVADLFELDERTHRFEAHYLHSLV